MFPLLDTKNVRNCGPLEIVTNFKQICDRARQTIGKKPDDDKLKCVFNDGACASHARTI